MDGSKLSGAWFSVASEPFSSCFMLFELANSSSGTCSACWEDILSWSDFFFPLLQCDAHAAYTSAHFWGVLSGQNCCC